MLCISCLHFLLLWQNALNKSSLRNKRVYLVLSSRGQCILAGKSHWHWPWIKPSFKVFILKISMVLRFSIYNSNTQPPRKGCVGLLNPPWVCQLLVLLSIPVQLSVTHLDIDSSWEYDFTGPLGFLLSSSWVVIWKGSPSLQVSAETASHTLF